MCVVMVTRPFSRSPGVPWSGVGGLRPGSGVCRRESRQAAGAGAAAASPQPAACGAAARHPGLLRRRGVPGLALPAGLVVLAGPGSAERRPVRPAGPVRSGLPQAGSAAARRPASHRKLAFVTLTAPGSERVGFTGSVPFPVRWTWWAWLKLSTSC